ncbi:hypothetical protein SAMN05444274_106125 [Mariniphaga anaerophila]|uniref:Uncharacterized protein n=1 Tax=Mariniphaga anaerophila TaxID=1484053 RepID=A0A1M5CI84_9BACT|nr:hypothetical protein [Mariniphaga anaerophila]SHF54122.1 hypothetical protein SAMN05444274_106125 [Mariniphaga anaerophila]
MLAKYYQYNHTEPAIELLISRMDEMISSHFASNLLNQLVNAESFNMENSVKKAITILRLIGVPVHEHISGIYRSDFNGMRKDWQFSELACSLIILTSGTTSDQAEQIQTELLEFYGL